MNRTALACLLAALLAACSSPPKPPQCTGEFRPVNQAGLLDRNVEGKRHGD